MKLEYTKVATLAATLITFGSLAGGAKAAIVVDIYNVDGGLGISISGGADFSGLSLIEEDSFEPLAGALLGATGGQYVISDSNDVVDELSGVTLSLNAWSPDVLSLGVGTGTGPSSIPLVRLYADGRIRIDREKFPVGSSTVYSTTREGDFLASINSFYGYTYNGDAIADLGLVDGVISSVSWTSDSGAESIIFRTGSAAIPEPSSALLVGLAALGVIGVRRRKAR